MLRQNALIYFFKTFSDESNFIIKNAITSLSLKRCKLIAPIINFAIAIPFLLYFHCLSRVVSLEKNVEIGMLQVRGG